MEKNDTNEPKEQTGGAIPIGNKIDFNPKLIKRDRKGHYKVIKDCILIIS